METGITSIMNNKPSAKIILDSISPVGARITTMELNMHRFILAQFNTHRMFSRNSASSRAIPISKIIKRVKENPALPIHWGKNQKGMSAREEHSLEDQKKLKKYWLWHRDRAVEMAQILDSNGLHKQLTNRLLEPFMWHSCIVTATEWDNFFSQRCSSDAQPEIHALALAMREAYENSTPQKRTKHFPYIMEDENNLYSFDKLKISIARCARVSYLNHDGVRDIEKDYELYDKLRTANPPHRSPFEHVAFWSEKKDSFYYNLRGWSSARYLQDKHISLQRICDQHELIWSS